MGRLVVREADSPTGIGAQSAIVKFGNGDWEILGASVHGGLYEYFAVKFMYRYKDSDGTWIESYLGGGYGAGVYYPVVMITPKFVRGPGELYSVATHGASLSHHLRVVSRRMDEKQGGLFG